MEGYYLRWSKFVECYCDVYEGWAQPMQERLVEIAVNSNNITLKEYKDFTYWMAMSFINNKQERINQLCNESKNENE